jgi:hypothetical protein
MWSQIASILQRMAAVFNAVPISSGRRGNLGHRRRSRNQEETRTPTIFRKIKEETRTPTIFRKIMHVLHFCELSQRWIKGVPGELALKKLRHQRTPSWPFAEQDISWTRLLRTPTRERTQTR